MSTNTAPQPLSGPSSPVHPPVPAPTTQTERNGARRADASARISRRARPSKALQIAAFAGLSALLLVPIWIVKYPPLIDYPNHLARAFILNHLHDPAYKFGQYYASDWGLNPYFLGDALMQLFQRFVDVYVAGKILLSLCLVTFPLGVAYFLRRANPGNEYLALWAFAVAYNPNFLMGFMSFYLSIGLCFFAVGVWLDYARTGEDKYWVRTLMLATLCFLTHLGGFGVAAVMILTHTVLTGGMGRRLVKALLVFVPGGVFFLYAKMHGWAKRDLDYSTWRLGPKIKGMLVPFREYSHVVEGLTILALILTVAYFLRRKDRLRLQTEWVVIAGVILAIHWMVPGMYGDLAFIDYRFCLFAFLIALAIPAFRGPRTIPVALAGIVIVAHIVGATRYFRAEQAHLAGLAQEFSLIPRNSMVLAYTAKSTGSWEGRDDLHFWGYGVIERGWITPSVFHQKSVQPIELRVPMYSDNDQYGVKLLEGQYDPKQIAENYDYLWTSNTGYLDQKLNQIGTPVATKGELKIYKSKERTLGSAKHAAER